MGLATIKKAALKFSAAVYWLSPMSIPLNCLESKHQSNES